MEATEIITPEQAKNWLSANNTEDLPRLIASALDFVQTYTGHTLIGYDKTIQTPCYAYGIRLYPIIINSVKNVNGDVLEYKTRQTTYNTYIDAPIGSLVNLTVGYQTVAEIPPMLVEVAYKMLTYLYENRDIYIASLPQDFQIMINKYRRNLV